MPERYWLTFTTRHRHGRPTQEPVYYQREGDRWRLYFGKSGRRRAVGTESDAAVRWQVDLAKSEGRFVRHEPDQGRMFNPLVRGYSRGAIAANIRREIHAGRDQDQAVAIALATARRAYRSRHPRGRLPAQLRRNPPMHNPLYGAEAAKVMRRMDQAQRELDLASREAGGDRQATGRHAARGSPLRPHSGPLPLRRPHERQGARDEGGRPARSRAESRLRRNAPRRQPPPDPRPARPPRGLQRALDAARRSRNQRGSREASRHLHAGAGASASTTQPQPWRVDRPPGAAGVPGAADSRPNDSSRRLTR